MNRINPLLKPAHLAILVLLLGSDLASAAEPVAELPIKPAVEATVFDKAPPATQTDIIRLAWDRVGAVA